MTEKIIRKHCASRDCIFIVDRDVRITIEGNATTSFSPDVIKSVLSPFLVVSSVDISSLQPEGINESV